MREDRGRETVRMRETEGEEGEREWGGREGRRGRKREEEEENEMRGRGKIGERERRREEKERGSLCIKTLSFHSCHDLGIVKHLQRGAEILNTCSNK